MENKAGIRFDKRDILQAVGILCLCFMLMGTSAITASLQLIGKYLDVPYSAVTMLETCPALAAIPFTLLSGAFAGKRISFRMLAIIGLAGYIVFGALPFFLQSFAAILICRLLLGASMGLMVPLGNSLMILTLPEKMVSTMVGLHLVVENIGILILQNVANALVKVSTPCVWLCYLIGILPFIGMLFLLKEPVKPECGPRALNGAGAAPEKTGLPGIVWPIGIMFLFFAMFFMVSSSGLSEIVIGDGIGTVDDVTTILNINVIVSLVCGMAFGIIYNFTKRITVYIGFAFCILGLGLMGFSEGMGLIIACSIMLAIGYTMCCSSFMMEVNRIIPPSAIAVGTALVSSMASFGVSLASEWYVAIQKLFRYDSMRIVMFESAIGLIIVMVVHLILQKRMDSAAEANMKGLG